MKNQVRKLAEVGVVAAVYAALVYLLAPVSFAVLQFRVAEVVKSLAIFRKHTIWAMGIGVAVANLASPYVGVWELAWMPAMNLVGGYVAWFVGTKVNPYAGAAFLAAWISVAVAVMLRTVLGLPFWPTFVTILVPEAILVIGGVPVMRWVSERVSD